MEIYIDKYFRLRYNIENKEMHPERCPSGLWSQP